MKKTFLASALALSLSFGSACLSFAQPPSPQPNQQQQQFKEHKFQEVKEKRLHIIHERIERLEQRKACIEQAQDFQALRNCR
jgi:TolA-binding protein